MGFMDTVSNFTKGAAQKAKGGADIVALKAQIASVQREINNLYQQIGEKYYKAHKEDPQSDLERLVATITERLDKLEELEKQVDATKEATAAISLTTGEPAYAPGAFKKCPNCGAKVDENSDYCRSCGAKVEETIINSTASECKDENPDDFTEV